MGTEVEQNRKATRGSLKKGSGLLMSISVIGFLFFYLSFSGSTGPNPASPPSRFPRNSTA